MPIITFSMKQLTPIIKQLNETMLPLRANSEDLFNPLIHNNGIVVDNGGLTQDHPDFSFPSSKNIDCSKLEKKLWLVKDSGVYLMSNATHTPAIVAYAKGCNPRTDEDWFETSQRLFGADDGCDSISLDWYTDALKHNKRVFKLKLTKSSIELVL